MVVFVSEKAKTKLPTLQQNERMNAGKNLEFSSTNQTVYIDHLPLKESVSSVMFNKSTGKLVVYAAGIFLCYFYFGILQEKILRGTYGPEKERFVYTQALIFAQCVTNALFAYILLHTVCPEGKDTTTHVYYILGSSFYLGAMFTSFKALQFVNYPTQVVGKSCKPIPVMILGVLLARKRYPWLKYFFVFLIVVGVALFIYKDGKSSQNNPGPMFGYGEGLLVISLLLDGLIGVVQERMKTAHNTRAMNMMFKNNMYSVLYIVIALLYTGELVLFMGFVRRHVFVLYDVAMFCVMSALGQTFIYRTVAEFGPLPCSIVTTTRKFFTVLCSVLFFGNSLSNRQWLGTTLVFSGLFLDACFGKKK